VFNMGFVAHHLIRFTREALRGEHNASFYAAQDKATAVPRGKAAVGGSPLPPEPHPGASASPSPGMCPRPEAGFPMAQARPVATVVASSAAAIMTRCTASLPFSDASASRARRRSCATIRRCGRPISAAATDGRTGGAPWRVTCSSLSRRMMRNTSSTSFGARPIEGSSRSRISVENGRIRFQGPAAQLRDDPQVRAAYLGGGH
jgi:hypothetical protein